MTCTLAVKIHTVTSHFLQPSAHASVMRFGLVEIEYLVTIALKVLYFMEHWMRCNCSSDCQRTTLYVGNCPQVLDDLAGKL